MTVCINCNQESNTSRRHAQDCKKAAEEAGLINVNLGNIHILGEDYTWS